MEYLTGLVDQIEALPGILSDWSLPGANTESAAYEIARTVCRRAERASVRLAEMSPEGENWVLPEVLAFLNRLSDSDLAIWALDRAEGECGFEAAGRVDARAGVFAGVVRLGSFWA